MLIERSKVIAYNSYKRAHPSVLLLPQFEGGGQQGGRELSLEGAGETLIFVMRGQLDIAVAGFGVIWGHQKRMGRRPGREGGRGGTLGEQPSGLELAAGSERGRDGGKGE